MARPERENTDHKADGKDQPECGIIMPISATSTNSEAHWREVQILLHRAVANAGFIPRNVWESSTTDRVSERIIGNIFNFPLAVADVSDLNPNVMFELGLRLASKKPTIVVVNAGGIIPFDIRDFHAIFYPSDLNMLGMEDFFGKLGKVAREKYTAYKSENYTPFLNNVIVDVASPETRELGLNELLLSRLDDLAERLGRMESSRRVSANIPGGTQAGTGFMSGIYGFRISPDKLEEFKSVIQPWYEVDGIYGVETDEDGLRGRIQYSGGAEYVSNLYGRLEETINRLGGEMDIPF